MCLLFAAPLFAADSDGASYFESKVRPLLVQQCFACHSAASNPVMGGLRLDSREAVLKGGSRGASVVPGKPAESLLVRVVRHEAGNLKMPVGPRMRDGDAAVLAKWVEMGVPWGASPGAVAPAEKFWSFAAPREPVVPAVKNRAWIRSPIDAFILANLEAKGVAPAPAADKRTLIRRVTFDLTGLPPTPAEVQAFLADSSPEAFARVVDRLLMSPRYGERWGRHWLDVARYADSNGLDENLVYKNAFRYRNYVIEAFNKDKPYDQFIHEQLAGDLLPESADLPTQFERWTATGFLSLGAKMLAEDDPVKMEVDIVDEQLDTVARTFMGLTIGCARCHDHKFDPIPQADYYSLAGIFKSSKTMENFRVVAKWHEYVLAPKEDRDRLEAHEASVEAKRKEAGKITSAENRKLTDEALSRVGSYLLAAHDIEVSSRIRLVAARGGVIVTRDAGSFDAGNVPREIEKKKPNTPKGGKGPYFAEYKVEAQAAGEYQIDMMDEERGAGTADLHINGVLVMRGAEAVQNREASPDEGGWAPAGVFALKAGGNVLRLEHASRFPYFAKLRVARAAIPAGGVIPRTTAQIALARGVNASFLEQLVEHLKRSNAAAASQLYAWEVYGTNKPLADWSSPAAALFRGFAGSREELASKYEQLFNEARKQSEGRKEPLADAGLEALRQLLIEKFGPFRAPGDARRYYPQESREQLARIEKEAKDLEDTTPEFPRAMGVREGAKIADMPIHIRGSHWTLGKEVPRRFLSVIAGDKQEPLGTQSSGRLELARWITSPGHPLTSRVMVNRLWRWHFGRGIVPSSDNFGRLGEKPLNQPLLDWLALRFIEKGWSIKAMHRMMLLSSTYQMSSAYDAKAAEADPENTWQWRTSRRRLEVEAVRDAIMAVSTDLDLTPAGTIMNYKDRAYVANTSRRGDIDYDRNIRAVYIPVVRSSMYDLFRAFDLPDPSTPNGDRDSTVVAPQALFMLNGAVVLHHSRKMAESLLAIPAADDAARVREAYERAYSRPATPGEVDRALSFIDRMSRVAREGAGDPRVLAWQSFCKAIIGSNEFIYLN